VSAPIGFGDRGNRELRMLSFQTIANSNLMQVARSITLTFGSYRGTSGFVVSLGGRGVP
jgi:hypothetical protein